MLIHLGQDFVVRDREILGVFDLDTAGASRRTGASEQALARTFSRDTATDAGQKEKLTDAFLRRAQREGAVVDVSGAMPKSFVLTDFAGETVYITQLSTGALRRRAHYF